MRADGFAPIEGYAMLSDQRTAALVARDGAVDWLCVPRFDDAPMFARLLDPERGGAFTLAPVEVHESERRYLEDTNVLETTFTTASGAVKVTDALVVSAQIQRFSQLVRRVDGVSGSVEMAWAVRPRFGWELAEPEIREHDAGHVFAHGDVEALLQHDGMGEAAVVDGGVEGGGVVAEGEQALLGLLVVHSFPLLASSIADVDRRLDETEEHWRRSLAPLVYHGPWDADVRRSTLALLGCVHDETGAMVAAPTTSLPERVGGDRNYDYRYCWVRDTAFALDATMRLGVDQLAQATMGWLLRAERRTHPRVNVFFDLDGEPFRPQSEQDLHGYRGSRPVLLGNDAGSQLQLGSFGDLMQTAWLFVRDGNALDGESALHLAEVADHVCAIWRNPDSGIWELEDKRDYTRSKLQAWLALERAIDLAADGQIPAGRSDLWEAERAAIRAWIEEHCLDADGVYLRDGNGSGELDCAELLIARSGFVPGDDPSCIATIDRIRSELSAGGPLLYRYTGQASEEGAFVACSFWLVEALARAGRLDEACATMDETLALVRNDLGLMSEELDPASHAQLGNFPQALSHLSLLNAAALVAEGLAES